MPTVVIGYEGFGGIQVETDLLHAIGAEVINTKSTETPDAQAAIAKADALMVTIQKVPADLIAKMERCKIISRVGTGLDAIDIPAATKHGVWVTNVPDYSIDEVSTHAITLLLTHARRIPLMFDMIRQSGWFDGARVQPIQRLSGQTLGLIGFGRIGQAVATKARGLGLQVLVYDPYVQEQALAAVGARQVDLDTLLRSADYISLHCPLTDSTRQIINAQTLAQVKPTCFLINTARGGLINENALVEGVRAGKLAGAAVDVLTIEPPTRDHPFITEEKILVTPHVAWLSKQAKHDVLVKGTEEVIRVLQGEKPRSPANRI